MTIPRAGQALRWLEKPNRHQNQAVQPEEQLNLMGGSVHRLGDLILISSCLYKN